MFNEDNIPDPTSMIERNVVTLNSVLNDIAEDPVILSDDDDRSQLSNATTTFNLVSQDILANDANEEGPLEQLHESELEDGELADPQRKRVSFAPSVATTGAGNTYFRLNMKIQVK